jgi:hypothetical protein
MTTKLFYLEKEAYYCIQQGTTCDHCNKEINNKFGFKRGFDRLFGGSLIIYCLGCFKELAIKPTEYEELNIGHVVDFIHINAKPIETPLKFPVSEAKGITVFEAVARPTDKTIDRTIHANRLSLEGANIGAPISLDYEEKKAENLYLNSCLKELSDLKNAKPILPKALDKPKDDEPKQLDDKSEAQA